MRKIIFLLMMWIPAFAGMTLVQGQTSVVATQATPSSSVVSYVSFQVTFSADSLLAARTNQVNILPYVDHIATISFKASGTTPNFRITSYLSNFYITDTTYWTLSQQWDTTGQYLGKPINDSLNLNVGGLPFRYGSFFVKGLDGNNKNVVLYVRVALYHKE